MAGAVGACVSAEAFPSFRKKAPTHLSVGNLPPNFSRSPRWKCFAIFSPPFNSRYFFVALRKNAATLLKYLSGRFRILTHNSSRSSSGSRRSRVWLQAFCCLPPSVCRSILTSNVWNNEINIKLLNISVHSRSKVEVFFLTDLATPPTPHQPLPQMHCAQRPTQSITRHLAAEEKHFPKVGVF